MKIFKPLLLLVATLSIASISCRKDRPQQPDQRLIGNWHYIDPNGNLHRLMFKDEKELSYSIKIKAATDYQVTYNGTYQVASDRLKFMATERQDLEAGKAPVITAFTGNLFESATFKFSGNQLILNYVSYPADAPLNMSLTFQRSLDF